MRYAVQKNVITSKSLYSKNILVNDSAKRKTLYYRMLLYSIYSRCCIFFNATNIHVSLVFFNAKIFLTANKHPIFVRRIFCL